MTYAEKLKDPRWQKKRLEILERDGFICNICFDSSTTLHVHHIYYSRSGNPWDVDENDLITVCEHCHSLLEYTKKHPFSIIRTIKKVTKKNEASFYCLCNDKSIFVFSYDHGKINQIAHIPSHVAKELSEFIQPYSYA